MDLTMQHLPSTELEQDIDQMVHESLAGGEVEDAGGDITAASDAPALRLDLGLNKSPMYAAAHPVQVSDSPRNSLTTAPKWIPVHPAIVQQQLQSNGGQTFSPNGEAANYAMTAYPDANTQLVPTSYNYQQAAPRYPHSSLEVHLANQPSLSLTMDRGGSDASTASTRYTQSTGEVPSATTGPSSASLSPFGYVYPDAATFSGHDSFPATWSQDLTAMAGGFPISMQDGTASFGGRFDAHSNTVSPMGSTFRDDFGGLDIKHGQVAPFQLQLGQQQQWQTGPLAPGEAHSHTPMSSQPTSAHPGSQHEMQPYTPTHYATWPAVPGQQFDAPYEVPSQPNMQHTFQAESSHPVPTSTSEPSYAHLRVSQPTGPPMRRALSVNAIMTPPETRPAQQDAAFNPYAGSKPQPMGQQGVLTSIHGPPSAVINGKAVRQQVVPLEHVKNQKPNQAERKSQAQQSHQSQQHPLNPLPPSANQTQPHQDDRQSSGIPTFGPSTIVLKTPVPRRPVSTLVDAPPATSSPRLDSNGDGGSLAEDADTTLETHNEAQHEYQAAQASRQDKAGYHSGAPVMPKGKFVAQLWSAINDPASRGQIEWDTNGIMVIFRDKKKFFKNAYPKHFAGGSQSNLTRNFFQWRFKIMDPQTLEVLEAQPGVEPMAYLHEGFQRDRPEKLRWMTRIKYASGKEQRRSSISVDPDQDYEPPSRSTRGSARRHQSKDHSDESKVSDSSPRDHPSSDRHQMTEQADTADSNAMSPDADRQDGDNDPLDPEDLNASCQPTVTRCSSRQNTHAQPECRFVTDPEKLDAPRRQEQELSIDDALEALMKEKELVQMLHERIRQLEAEAREKADHCQRFHREVPTQNYQPIQQTTQPMTYLQVDRRTPTPNGRPAEQLQQQFSSGPQHFAWPTSYTQPQVPLLHASPYPSIVAQSNASLGRPPSLHSAGTTPRQSRSASVSLGPVDVQFTPAPDQRQGNKRQRVAGPQGGRVTSRKQSVGIARNRVLSMQSGAHQPVPYSAIEASQSAHSFGQYLDDPDHRSRSECVRNSRQGLGS